jgi:hypothetical protein
MLVYTISALSNRQAISFKPNADVLNFDQAPISAGIQQITLEGANSRVSVLNGTDASKSVVLVSTAPRRATSNVSLANGHAPPFGDPSPSTTGHNGPHALNGTTAGINPSTTTTEIGMI